MLPTDAKARKDIPLDRGLLKYFPDALCAVAELSRIANEQHNPGEPIHWSKEKSSDHGDCLLRHQIDAGTIDTDKVRHSTKVAWRALAQLQMELEADAAKVPVKTTFAEPFTLTPIYSRKGQPWAFDQRSGKERRVDLTFSKCPTNAGRRYQYPNDRRKSTATKVAETTAATEMKIFRQVYVAADRRIEQRRKTSFGPATKQIGKGRSHDYTDSGEGKYVERRKAPTIIEPCHDHGVTL